MTRTLQFTLACCAGGLFAAPALAELPPALDLVPADAPVVVAIDDFNALLGEQGAVAKMLQAFGPLPMTGLDEIQQLSQVEGINPDGSVALIMTPPQEFGDSEQIIAIAPGRDYAAFARGLGGSGSGVEEVLMQGEAVFIKALGGGFAAMGPDRDLVAGFAGEAGASAAHEKRLGAVGMDIADRSQLMVIANMEKIGPMMQEQIRNSMMMAQMMGAPPGAAEGLKVMSDGMTQIIEDASTGVFGLGLSDAGLTMRMGAAFAEGTEAAAMFQGAGRSAQLMRRLPDQPYLIAGAMDISSEPVKKLLLRLNQLGAQMGGAGDVGAMATMMQKASGSAFLFGAARVEQIMSAGMFVNSVAFMESADPKGLIADFRKAQEGASGQEVEGMRVTTSYEPGAREVDGVTADAWGVKMEIVDTQNMELAMQAQMMAMMFGPDGLGGYIAPAEGGVAFTYARNSRALGLALATAAAGDGLGLSEQIQAVGSALPQDRTFELYLDVDEMLELAGAAMATMGGGELPFDREQFRLRIERQFAAAHGGHRGAGEFEHLVDVEVEFEGAVLRQGGAH
ncbi:MAG: hypothetical protein ACF8R7_04930, partial [Phycisphaerales bacterium JB039]